MMATTMIRPIQPAQIQKNRPSFFLPASSGCARASGSKALGAQGRGVSGKAAAIHSRAILGSTTVKMKSKMKLISTMATATTRVMPWTTV